MLMLAEQSEVEGQTHRLHPLLSLCSVQNLGLRPRGRVVPLSDRWGTLVRGVDSAVEADFVHPSVMRPLAL